MTEKVAVVITIKNDAQALTELLASLEQQTRRPDEVVLIVAQSVDGSLEVAQEWKPKGISVQILDVPAETTRSRARNLGVTSSTADVIVFTDAGCYPEKAWLEKLLVPLQHSAQLVSGLTLARANNAFERVQARFVLVDPDKIPLHPLPATRNMAITRKAWQKSGGFAEELNFGEDYALARSMQESGVVADLVPEAVVYWRPRGSLRQFFLMILRLTAGDIQSGFWRRGVLTMWLRYTVFLLVVILLFSAGRRLLIAAPLVLILYIAAKTVRLRLVQGTEILWVIPLQLSADAAVLGGTLLGLVWRTQRKENRTT